MKTLALLAALAGPLAAQPTPPDVKADAVAPSADGAGPSAESPDLMAPPPPEVKAAARKAAAAVAPKAAASSGEPRMTVSSPKLVETKPLPSAGGAFAGPETEWTFVSGLAAATDSAAQDAAIENLDMFARRYPDSAHAPDALLLLAGLRAARGDWQAAAADQLRLIYEYTASGDVLRAKSAYLELVAKNASRRHRPVLSDLVNGDDAADKADRLAALWQKVSLKAPDALYEPAAAAIRGFLERFPDYRDNDQLQAALARLHAANDKPASALAAWRKLLALYPASELRPGAQLAVGDLYADALRNPQKAIDAYQDLIAQYPDAFERQPAFENSARLFEDKLSQYGLAVSMDEQIVKLFPKSPASLRALKAIARLDRDRLSKPEDAIKTLQRLSAMHGGQDGVDALLLAAKIARRDLSDYGRQALLLRQVADDYAAAKEAPQALYDAGGVYEDDVKDATKAIDTYKELAAKYASNKLARKATDRAAKLSGVR